MKLKNSGFKAVVAGILGKGRENVAKSAAPALLAPSNRRAAMGAKAGKNKGATDMKDTPFSSMLKGAKK